MARFYSAFRHYSGWILVYALVLATPRLRFDGPVEVTAAALLILAGGVIALARGPKRRDAAEMAGVFLRGSVQAAAGFALVALPWMLLAPEAGSSVFEFAAGRADRLSPVHAIASGVFCAAWVAGHLARRAFGPGGRP